MKTFSRAGLALAVTMAAIAAQAQTTTLKYNVEYTCGAERIVVGHCRSDSDQFGSPATSPSQDYCMVYYPDRPKHNGISIQAAELRSDVVKKLQACGAVAASPAKSVQPKNSSASAAVAYATQGSDYFKAEKYAKAVEAYRNAIALQPTSGAYLGLGAAYYKLDQFQDALVAFEGALRLAPGDYSVHYWFGVTYYQQKQYPKALAELQEGIRLKPDDPYLHHWLGEVYQFGFKQYDKAASAYLEARRLNPGDARNHNELGLAYSELGQHANALAEFKDAVRLKPGEPLYQSNLGLAYLAVGKPQEARQVCTTLSKLDPKMAGELMKAIAAEETSQILNQAKNQKQAAPVAGKTANPAAAQTAAPSGTASAQSGSQPKTALEYLKLGDKLNGQQDYARAIEAYKEGMALKPDNTNAANASNSMGVAYYRLQQYQEAVAAFQQAVHFKPDYPMAYFNLGVNYGELKQYEKAVEAYREAVRLKPDFVDAEYRLGAAYFNLENYAQSAAAFHQAIHQNAMNFSQYPDTVAAFEQAVRLKPDDAELQYDFGWACVVFKQYEKAIPALNKALRLKPDSVEANSRLASAYFGLRQFAKAVPYYEEVIRLNPASGPEYFNLGTTYLALGKSAEAMKVYEKLKPVDPSWGDMLSKEITMMPKAEQGDPEAQNTLGFRYENGMGRFPQDREEARKWYTRSANQGYGAGQHNLCSFYTKPMEIFKGVDSGEFPLPKINANRQDMIEAIGWCFKATEQQFDESLYKLILLYARGSADIKPDYEKAYFWLCVRRSPADLREKVGKQISEAKRTENENLAKLWKPTKTTLAAKP